ncbi:MAG: sugar transferase [Candidatus Gribaldobacteria bacterium]|nr:sugar transferase [Candidatus Gribaldobacteria bacterium]
MLKKVRQFILLLGDLGLAFLALLLTVRIGFWSEFSWSIFQKHLLPFTLLYLLWFVIFYIFGLYDLNSIKPKRELFTRIGQAFLTCFGISILLFYLVDFFGLTPKSNLILNVFILAFLTLSWRRLFCSFFSAWYLQQVAFLGKNNLAEKLITSFEHNPQMGYKFCGFLNQEVTTLEQLTSQKIDILIVAQNILANKKITKELYDPLYLKIKIWDLTTAYEQILQKIPVSSVSHSWFLENLKESEKKIYDQLKRLSDLAIAFVLLIITSPLWLIIATLIKLEDNGPIFYKQTRVGKNKRIFKLWKFRSMQVDAEKQGAQWANKNDPRVTKIGKVIRQWHLDEFPQMLNVLKGDIALVGPRPERPEFVTQLEQKVPYYPLRHLIKSGFTGWAQIKFHYARTIQDSQEKFEYDLFYIKNRSFFLDLGILLKTFQLFLKRER